MLHQHVFLQLDHDLHVVVWVASTMLPGQVPCLLEGALSSLRFISSHPSQGLVLRTKYQEAHHGGLGEGDSPPPPESVGIKQATFST